MMNVKEKNDVSESLKEMSGRELGNVSVFVIEDDVLISELIVEKLVQNGCIPYSTNKGSEAIDLAEKYKPDAIILDLMLPDMSGEEIIAILKTKENLKSIPVIVFSNKSDQKDRENLMSLGADKYFVKAAMDLNDLVSEIKDLLKK